MRWTRGRRVGCVGVVGVVAAMTAAPAGALPLPAEDRAFLSSSVVSSPSAPKVLVPGGRGTTVVVTNIGRTPTKPLRSRLVLGPGAAAYTIVTDRCTGKVLKPRRECRVRVRYAAAVAPEADATATLRVSARGKRKLVTTTYFTVAARQRVAPVAVGDSFTLGRGGSLSAGAPGVLGNDRDPDGRALTAVLVEGVKHGALTLNGDGSFAYKPAAEYAGPDSFVYRAVDGDGLGAVATVSISVVASNRAPVAADDAGTVTENAAPETATGNLLANDSDPDGDALTVVTTSPPGHGALVVAADGSYTYTLDNSDPLVDALDAGESLVEDLAYAVSDGRGHDGIARLRITIHGTTDNQAPTVVADAASIKEDAAPNPVSGNVLSNDSDSNGDTLTVVNAGTLTLQYGSVVLTANGSWTYALDNSDPVVDALNNGQHLTDTVIYTASDGHGGTSSSTLTVTINGTTDNHEPTAVADTASIKEDTAPNPITGNVLTNDSDADGHTLTVVNAGTLTLQYGALVLAANGSWTYTLDNSDPVVDALNNGQHLTDTVIYTASDGHGGTSSATLTITIDGTTG